MRTYPFAEVARRGIPRRYSMSTSARRGVVGDQRTRGQHSHSQHSKASPAKAVKKPPAARLALVAYWRQRGTQLYIYSNTQMSIWGGRQKDD